MILRPFLPITSDETLASWGTRLAATHAGGTLIPFLRDIGIPPHDMFTGSDLAIDRLAEVTGADRDALLQQTIQALGGREYRLRGEVFTIEFMKGSVTSFCPECLLEDDEAGSPMLHRRSRLLWRFRSVRTCSRHGIPLISRPYLDWVDRLHQMSLVVQEYGQALRNLRSGLPHRGVSGLQRYLSDRLNGQTGPTRLDGQGIEQAARATEMLGVGLIYGPYPNLNLLSADEWERAASKGYEFTSRNEEGIRAALSELQRIGWSKGKTSGQAGPQVIFGRLYQWLNFNKNGKDFGPIRKVVRDHILNTMFLRPGSMLFGEPVHSTKMTTLADLAHKHKVKRAVLRGALEASGIILENAPGGGFHLESAACEKVAIKLKGTVQRSSIPDYINATQGQVNILLESEILPRASVFKGYKYKLGAGVEKDVLDAFLQALLLDAREVSSLPTGVYPVNAVAMRAKRSTEAIIRLLLKRRLTRVFKLRGLHGYRSVNVDPDEVRCLCSADINSGGISLTQAGKILKVKGKTVQALMARGGQKPSLESVPTKLGGTQKVPVVDVEKFREDYISASELAEKFGMSSASIQKKLQELYVVPMGDPKELGEAIYRRKGVPIHLLKLRL